jgi:hypothetical protein
MVTEKSHILTDMLVSGTALEAIATGQMCLHSDSVAYFQVSDILSNRFYNPAALVSRNKRRFGDQMPNGWVPVIEHYITSANGS